MTSAGTLDVVALDAAVCDVLGSVVYSVCRVCLSASRLPPMRIGSVRGAWIRSSRLKAVAEATERVHQRPVLVLSPSVGELLPLCHYDYMMLLIPRSK